MFVKYVMATNKDYRGHVKLVVRNEQKQEVAYSLVDTLDADMVSLTDAEIGLVKKHSPGVWYNQRDRYILDIDRMADLIRQSWLEAGTNTINIEYKQVEESLKEWRAAGSNAATVPEDVLIWKQATGNSTEWAISDIETRINAYRNVLTSIRRIRLLGKQDLRDATGVDLFDVYNRVVVQLEAIRGSSSNPGV